MKFEKGHQKKGGRKTGSSNKVTTELRDKLQSIIEMTVDELPELLGQMAPEERVKALTALLPYVVPKLSNVEVSGTDNGTIRVSLNLNPEKP